MTEYQEAGCSKGWTHNWKRTSADSSKPSAGICSRCDVMRMSADDDDQADHHATLTS